MVVLLAHPYLEAAPAGPLLLSALAGVVPLAGVYAVSAHRLSFWIAAVLAVPTVLGSFRSLAGLGPVPAAPAFLFPLLFYGFTLVVIARDVLSPDEVRTDTLFGAACVYLLLGVTWSMAFGLVESTSPGAFTTGGGNPPIWSDFLYLSFATLTTLGYGDVLPVTGAARSLAMLEAVTGVLYVALLIARLVGLYRRSASA